MTNRTLIFYWKKKFLDSGLQSEITEIYLAYIKRLLKNKVPIIFDFDHLCLLLGRSPKYLASVLNASSHHYREFTIPKRNGEKRAITVPYPALMECQYWIYNNILRHLKSHPSAQGFSRKKSIVTNATIHVNQNHFLKIDIKDFFPSISFYNVVKIFRDIGYTKRVSFYLAAICCFKNSDLHNDSSIVPQGAPTSPAISNLVSRNLDKRLAGLSKKNNLNYTRYADDLAFSGEEIPATIIKSIERILLDEGYEINSSKTVLNTTKRKRILTGISIAGETISLPREYKRNLKQEIHYVLNYGLHSHIRKLKIKNADYLESLIGRLNFWLNVEKDNVYAKAALNTIIETYKPNIKKKKN